MKYLLRRNFKALFLLLLAVASVVVSFTANRDDPWRPDQLLEPQMLNTILSTYKSESLPVIFNIGPVNNIKGAISIGPASGADGLTTLAAHLKDIPKDKLIVIYCGCCPLFKCPNVRPAFKLLTDGGYTNIRVLNLQHNLKTDWVDAGYPVEDK